MATCHVRSISLPTRSHPLKESIEELLCKFKASQSSSSSVCNKLAGLKELYECVDDFLQLPLTQQNLSDVCVEDIMNGSLKMLDICSTTRGIFSQAKESLKELESSLRRSRCKESSLATEIDAYMAARKILNKEINKCLRNLKRKEKNLRAASSVEAANILRSVEEISVSVFDDMLSLVSQPKSKPSGWSIVSKLMQSKRVSCESNVEAREAGKIDAELLVLKSSKGTDLAQVQNLLKGLEEFELSLQEMEEEMDCIYRRMVKARVTLLNMLTH